ncbi:hypothetical protein MTR_5g027120 [Medicago truncatula]|uniref:Uncharacterized protein n=1 Tax=Medicago truncatula TaxID=3880 RepID=G7K848_MEDTR|nr:hypothetical protein MTR_5g027120 [Medicago truncatula]
MTYVENNCFFDIDEWLEHANKFCKSFNHHTEENLEADCKGIYQKSRGSIFSVGKEYLEG